jgi:hypothetical protein
MCDRPASNEIEVTADMIRAGAEAMCDGSDLGNEFSPSVAEYFSECVIRAALDAAFHRKL